MVRQIRPVRPVHHLEILIPTVDILYMGVSARKEEDAGMDSGEGAKGKLKMPSVPSVPACPKSTIANPTSYPGFWCACAVTTANSRPLNLAAQAAQLPCLDKTRRGNGNGCCFCFHSIIIA